MSAMGWIPLFYNGNMLVGLRYRIMLLPVWVCILAVSYITFTMG